jgi:uncharacterized membrane protein
MSFETSQTRHIARSERQAATGCCTSGSQNVGESERLISLIGGGVLLAYGLSRGSATGLGIGLIGAGLAYRGWTGHCHAYEALGFSSAEHSDQTSIPSGQGIKVEHDVTIQKPADELFRFWRKLDNLPRIMRHLNSVEDLGNGRSRWNAKGPFGDVQWEAEIITERPGELIGWRSLENSTIQTAGSVHFRRAPGDRGTEVKVVLSYNPPGGQVGHALAWLAGSDPKAEIREDLRNFKRTMETASAPSPPTRAQAQATASPATARPPGE